MTTDVQGLLKWLRYERIDGVPDEERRRECAAIIERQAAELEATNNALVEAQTRPHEAIGWLIEWPGSDNFPTRWWHPVTGWMLGANDAVRFSRKVDAESYMADMHVGDKLVATEHEWIAALTPQGGDRRNDNEV